MNKATMTVQGPATRIHVDSTRVKANKEANVKAEDRQPSISVRLKDEYDDEPYDRKFLVNKVEVQGPVIVEEHYDASLPGGLVVSVVTDAPVVMHYEEEEEGDGPEVDYLNGWGC